MGGNSSFIRAKNRQFFIHYGEPNEYPQAPHLKVQIGNPDEKRMKFIDELKAQGYDIDADDPIEEGRPSREEYSKESIRQSERNWQTQPRRISEATQK